jgi:vacuolar protein 8
MRRLRCRASRTTTEVFIADDGAIAPLVTLVQSGTDRQKEHAAGALQNLAANAENKVLIAQAGAIAPLVTLVQSGTAGQKKHAASALRILAINAENEVFAQEGR